METLQATGPEPLRRTTASASHYALLRLAVGGWRLAVGGWRLAVGQHPAIRRLLDYLPLADARIGGGIALCARTSAR